jgi:hypothetical protein
MREKVNPKAKKVKPSRIRPPSIGKKVETIASFLLPYSAVPALAKKAKPIPLKGKHV